MKLKGIHTIIGLILILAVSAQEKAPVAIDDSVFAYAGSKIYINVLENDYWNVYNLLGGYSSWSAGQ